MIRHWSRRRQGLTRTALRRRSFKRQGMKRDSLDALFSLFIRRRDHWTCRRCRTVYAPPTKALHCAHIFGRGKLSVRFDPENAVALCYGCHRLLDTHPCNKTDFFIRLLGQAQYDALAVRASLPGKVDRVLVKLALEARIKELGEGC